MDLRKLLGNMVAVDTETTGLSPWKGARPFAFSFCNPDGVTHYVEFPVDPFSREVRYASNPEDYNAIKSYLQDEGVTKVFWNAKFDIRMCEYAEINVAGKFHEGLFAAHVCHSDELTFGLKPMAKKYVGIDDDDQKELKDAVNKLRRKAKKAGWAIAEKGEADYWLPTTAWRCGLITPGEAKKIADKCKVYAVRDAERTMLLWMLYEVQMKKLNVREVYEHEMELWPVTYSMETRGLCVNPKETEKLRQSYRKDQTAAMDEMRKVAGDFNPNSVLQVRKILYDKLKLKLAPDRYSKRNVEQSTDMDALLELSAQHKFPEHLSRYRAATKAITFCDMFDEQGVRGPDGVYALHTNFQQCGPKTGRFSARDPNIQQIPSKSAGRHAHPIDGRAPLGPRPGHTWFNIDYSQLEVRIYADQSQEDTLLEVIKSGQHVHSAITDHVWGGQNDTCIKAATDVLFATEGSAEDTPEWIAVRKKFWKGNRTATAEAWVKTFNWSIVKAEASLGRKNTVNKTKLMIFNQIYGGGIRSLMSLMRKPRDEVVQFVQYFDKRIPGMRKWNDEVTRQAAKDGFVRTAFGRRIPVDRDYAYKAVNYRIQGSAADLMKRALVQTNAYLRENNVKAWIVMTLHDEIIFEFHKSEDRMRHVLELKKIMENAGEKFCIPMTAEVERVRKRWSEKEKVKWAV